MISLDSFSVYCTDEETGLRNTAIFAYKMEGLHFLRLMIDALLDLSRVTLKLGYILISLNIFSIHRRNGYNRMLKYSQISTKSNNIALS